ncbi:diguanylate cyclase, partial [uncultured Jannaschia sp.]|uniref:diguanylate cyclase domain-containing protein n=1 Tax=uncultured Jannaschia sp. TaxID=293347 RepID=UPI00261C89A5
LIRAVARRLCAIVGENDMVARLGGDEFAIVQGRVTGRADVERLADAVMRSMTQPFDLLGNQVFVGASAGIAIASETASERADL